METDIFEKAIDLQAQLLNETENNFQKSLKLSDMLANPPEIETGMTPSEVVFRKHRTKLIRYRPEGDKTYRTPLMVVFAMVNKPYVLDLIPGKSVIEFLVKEGFDVYLFDWGIPTTIDNDKSLDLWINSYMDSAVDWLIEETGVSKISLMGYCMGGTMSLMYSALHPNKIKNLITMATPFDFSGTEGALFKWAKDFPFEELVDTFDSVPGWYLNLSFSMLKPTGGMDKMMTFWKKLMDDRFLKLFMAMEKWSADAKPVPGRAYLDFMKGTYRENLLIQNKFELDGKTVDLSKIKASYMNLIGSSDHLVPPSASDGIGEYLGSKDKDQIICKTGHIGLSVSGKAYKTMWPQVSKWLAERSGKMVKTN